MAEKLQGKLGKYEKEGARLLQRAKEHLRNNSKDWEKNKNLMLGQIGNSKSPIAEAYGYFRSLVQNTLVSVPTVYCESKNNQWRESAAGLGDAINYDFEIGNLRDRMVKALFQNFPYGYGVIAENVDTKKDASGLISGTYFSWKNAPPRDVLTDPDGFNIDLSDHRYGWLASYKTISQLKDEEYDYEPEEAAYGKKKGDKIYFNLEKVENAPAANEASKPGPGGDKMVGGGIQVAVDRNQPKTKNPDFHQVKIWRIYDRVNETMCEFLDADKRLIRYEKWPLIIRVQGISQFPWMFLAMNSEIDEFYPIPECRLISSQMLNMAKINDKFMADLTTKISKYIGLSPYVDENKMGKLMDTKKQNNFILTSNVDVLAQNANAPKIDEAAHAVAKLDEIQPDQMAPMGLQECRNQIQNIMAYGQPNRGGLPAIRSAKEASRVAEATQKAMMGRQTTIEKFVSDIARYHAMLLKATSGADRDAKRYANVTDQLTGLKSWIQYKPSDIPSEDDLFFAVYSGTSTPITTDQKRAQELQHIQLLWPMFQQAQISPMPLVMRAVEVMQLRYREALLANPKGKAMELVAAIARAAQLGDKTPPDLLIKTGLDLAKSILNPQEVQQVLQAVNQPGEGGTGGGGAPVNPASAGGSNAGGVPVEG
jgi:hypothetical protein